MGRRSLVLGGIRSGKSAWAEARLDREAKVTYVATSASRPDDAGWVARIGAHRSRRPASWSTVELGGSDGLAPLLAAAGEDDVLLVDDLGGWLTASLDRTGAWWEAEGRAPLPVIADCELLTGAWLHCRATVVAVSPEVGMSVVPPTRAGGLFADLLGRLNQDLAATSDEAVLVVAGQPLWLRGASTSDQEGPDRD